MQTKIARMMVMAPGGTSDDSRYLNTGILTPTIMFADNMKMCPLMGLPLVDSICDIDFFLFGEKT